MVKLAAGIVNQMQQFAFCSYLDPVVVGAAVLQAATFFFSFSVLRTTYQMHRFSFLLILQMVFHRTYSVI